MTDRLTDGRTDICDSRVAFATENNTFIKWCNIKLVGKGKYCLDLKCLFIFTYIFQFVNFNSNLAGLEVAL